MANRGTHISATRQINATPAQYLSTSAGAGPEDDRFPHRARFPNPFYGLNSVYSSQHLARQSSAALSRNSATFRSSQPVGYSWYHSLQVRVEKRFSQGYTLQAGYTYSKFMQATEFLNPTDPAPVSGHLRYGPAARIHAQRPVGTPGRDAAASSATNLPAPANFLLGGWQLDATVVRQAGAPLAFGNVIFNGDIKNIPLSKDERSADRWFNTNAGFEKNSKLALANNIRTFPLRFSGVRADGQSTWNFSLIKNFRIRERLNGAVPRRVLQRAGITPASTFRTGRRPVRLSARSRARYPSPEDSSSGSSYRSDARAETCKEGYAVGRALSLLLFPGTTLN